MSAWLESVNHIRDGEPVAQGPAGRPDRQLESRTGYLKERLDSLQGGEGNYAYQVPLDPAVLIGQPVYYNKGSARYEAAYWVTRSQDGGGTADAPAAVIGLLAQKSTGATDLALGDVLLCGRGPVDLSAALPAGAPVTAGLYYLSSTPGKLGAVDSPAGPLVCQADGQGLVIVLARPGAALEHAHYVFELTCLPAGSTVYPGEEGRHQVDGDAGLPGWLPVSHPSLEGLAPPRACFGYNLAAHPALGRLWPPVPLAAARLVWDRGGDDQTLQGGVEIPLGPDGLAVVDAAGLWWMSDCPADVPWPALTHSGQSSETQEASSDAPAECPRLRQMRLTLYLIGALGADNPGRVTSLVSSSPALTVKDCDGQEARTGDLVLSLFEEFLVAPGSAEGSLVLKDLQGGLFLKGPVVGGLVAADDSILLDGSLRGVDGADTLHRGVVRIQANLEPGSRDLLPQVVRLTDVRERSYQDVPYLGFPEGSGSSLRVKFKVPSSGVPTSPRFLLRGQFLGRATGTLPAFTCSFRRLPAPAPATPLATTDTVLSFPVPGAVGLDQVVLKESDSFAVAAGDVVLCSLGRAQGDGYAGEVGLVDLVGLLYPG